jgi:hypothetical protein
LSRVDQVLGPVAAACSGLESLASSSGIEIAASLIRVKGDLAAEPERAWPSCGQLTGLRRSLNLVCTLVRTRCKIPLVTCR